MDEGIRIPKLSAKWRFHSKPLRTSLQAARRYFQVNSMRMRHSLTYTKFKTKKKENIMQKMTLNLTGFMILIAFCYLNPTVANAKILRVPADHPTIQAAIDTADNGDTVLVADGTYFAQGNVNLNFNGKFGRNDVFPTSSPLSTTAPGRPPNSG
jgi:hypothetical protein